MSEEPEPVKAQFQFTDEQWLRFELASNDGLSHRGFLEYCVDKWLVQHDHEAKAQERNRILTIIETHMCEECATDSWSGFELELSCKDASLLVALVNQ